MTQRSQWHDISVTFIAVTQSHKTIITHIVRQRRTMLRSMHRLVSDTCVRHIMSNHFALKRAIVQLQKEKTLKTISMRFKLYSKFLNISLFDLFSLRIFNCIRDILPSKYTSINPGFPISPGFFSGSLVPSSYHSVFNKVWRLPWCLRRYKWRALHQLPEHFIYCCNSTISMCTNKELSNYWVL